jgi:hypothetical protein
MLKYLRVSPTKLARILIMLKKLGVLITKLAWILIIIYTEIVQDLDH